MVTALKNYCTVGDIPKNCACGAFSSRGSAGILNRQMLFIFWPQRFKINVNPLILDNTLQSRGAKLRGE